MHQYCNPATWLFKVTCDFGKALNTYDLTTGLFHMRLKCLKLGITEGKNRSLLIVLHHTFPSLTAFAAGTNEIGINNSFASKAVTTYLPSNCHILLCAHALLSGSVCTRPQLIKLRTNLHDCTSSCNMCLEDICMLIELGDEFGMLAACTNL